MITVTVREAGVEAARRRLRALTAGAGMVELRLDDLAAEPWPDLLAETTLPVMVTCRGRAGGGGFGGSEQERVALLERALQAGAACVDIELGSAAEDLLLSWPSQRLVLSHHQFQPGTAGVADKLDLLLASSRQLVVKLAYTAGRASDVLLARELLRRLAAEQRRGVILPMGERGVAGRLLAPAWGSAWTYASCDGAPPAAAGQLPLSIMSDLYRVNDIGPDTVLTGILGWPVDASLSPWMHNRALSALGIDGRYLPFAEDDAADFLLNADALGLRGVSVTHPHKETVLPWVEDLAGAARGCGAVNTLTFAAAGLRGDNTDGAAARLALEEALPADWTWKGRQVAIAGAGGAARAVAWELGRRQAKVSLYARDPARARQAAVAVGARCLPLADLPAAAPDVLVHATPVGMSPRPSACLPEAAGCPAGLVLDLVSNPRRTALLTAAAANGCATQEGLVMLVRQGEAQFRLWHGEAPPAGLFAAAAREGLQHSARP
jgi:3-dehydroquinate dehydratase/shikimate dehydrogenase